MLTNSIYISFSLRHVLLSLKSRVVINWGLPLKVRINKSVVLLPKVGARVVSF